MLSLSAGGTAEEADTLAGLIQTPERALSSPQEYLQTIRRLEDYLLEKPYDYREEKVLYSLRSTQNRLIKTYIVHLAGNLRDQFPETPELANLLLKRFEYAAYIRSLDIQDEVEAYARRYASQAEKVEEARYWLAKTKISRNYNKPGPIQDAIARFEEKYPQSERLIEVYKKGHRYLRNSPAQEQLFQQMKEKFPNADYVKGIARQKDRQAYLQSLRGTPFELSFENRLTGRSLSIADLRGKIVVIDFWSTHCGPCVAEIPHMVELHKKFKNRNVQFIGIALNKDPQTVVDFCREKGVTWPQYCEEGKYWDTAPVQQWKITGIPTLFVLDKEGRIYSADARGKVDRLIQELL